MRRLLLPLLLLPALAVTVSAAPAPLAFRWSPEISGAEPFRANAFHGETFTLCATPLQYGEPLTGLEGARAALYWQTPGMEPTQWYTAPGTYDAGTGTISAEWTPAMDVGSDRVTFFIALTQGDAVAYRVYGTLALKPSPGFDPAAIEPVDVRDELADQIAADVIGEIDGRYLSEESDPTVPAWAKAPEKPAYTAAEVGAAPESHAHAVSDVDGLRTALDAKQPAGEYLLSGGRTNNLGGAAGAAVTLVNRSADGTQHPLIRLASQLDGSAARPDRWIAEIYYNRLIYRMTPGSEPVEYAFDPAAELGLVRRRDLLAYQPAGDYLSSETDPTVPAWAKAPEKPSYAWGEITGKPATYAPSAHTHDPSDVDGLQDLLHSHAPQSAPFVAEGDGSVATLTVPEGLGPLLADTASAAAEAYRITADPADWPTDGAVRDVIVRNASSALTLDADALTLADYDLLTANATLGLRFTRVGSRIIVSILWRSEL